MYESSYLILLSSSITSFLSNVAPLNISYFCLKMYWSKCWGAQLRLCVNYRLKNKKFIELKVHKMMPKQSLCRFFILWIFQRSKPTFIVLALLDAIFGNGYQVVINALAPSEMSSVKFANLFGSLYNTRRNIELDGLLFIAHYDALSPSAQLSFESDSSGTGTVALLSIACMMSRLYASTDTQPKLVPFLNLPLLWFDRWEENRYSYR